MENTAVVSPRSEALVAGKIVGQYTRPRTARTYGQTYGGQSADFS